MQRLSGLDASFLYLETSSQVLHVCGLLTLDGSTVPGGYTFAKLKQRLEERVRVIPAFRRKLHNPLWNLSHPVWVEDEDFDLDHHVHRIGVPAPGDRVELAELCAHIAGQQLDRAYPLWQLYVIEGLADGEIAVLLKMHHASVDGVSGASLITYLAGLEPDAPAPEVTERANSGVPAAFDILRSSVFNVVKGPLEVARLLPDLLELVPRWLGKALRGKGMPIPFTAPRTSLNGTITGHRSVAFAQLELDDVKAVKNAFGVTVNDVVLALVAGALREFLDARGELPEDPLVATVPVSVHDRTERDHGSNKVSAFFASLPTHLADPAARVFFLAEANRLSKDHHHDIDADMLQDWAQFSAATAFGMAVRAYSALRLAEKHPVVHNLVVSNVPGPPMPLYLLGARITGLYPLGPVFHGAGLNVTVLSNAGKVHVGLIGARELVKDLWPLADALPEALAQLLKAAPG
ncbi:wax ester/triacylglycerol synthase family O-acyltransferase [Amycolatopsis sp. WQ 127309]|uniref:WS/DGAT/MGAT family O-acyltransferase n=1 Tax=Amycolatopsis sp. WQ 127309 TaxID=2932773 RepID=UPI001FF6A49B|nr:wax ester/triacylglycerol synthase family O-acyltransferase [Amycolatopsis sp. WQ 127309]UOZ11473.1 wax ester/triacylglycerol synthase family O-acyltransferase [Amycolatopsis sp. WQ 127309]